MAQDISGVILVLFIYDCSFKSYFDVAFNFLFHFNVSSFLFFCNFTLFFIIFVLLLLFV